MPRTDLALVAHLMRRAGFGASRAELERLAEKDYAEIVEDLLHPERFPDVPEDLLRRYNDGEAIDVWASRWIFRMVNSPRQLQEKTALFWHHVFATAWYKGEHTVSMFQQIDMLRRVGLSNTRTILIELSKNPAMIFWLDNNENHKDEPNENYGRELLGAVLDGRRQLHRAGHQAGGPGVHRLDPSRSPYRCTRTVTTPRRSSTTTTTTTTASRLSWARRAGSTARISSTS